MLQPKGAGFSFRELTHEVYAIVFQFVGKYLVWYDFVVVESGGNMG